MPGPQTLHSKWQEGNALAVAGLPGLVQLALVGIVVGMSWSGGCSSDCLDWLGLVQLLLLINKLWIVWGVRIS